MVAPLDPEAVRHLIECLVSEGGAVDGVTRQRQATVDGLSLDEYLQVLREIRRLCARFGHEVRRLTRIAIGPISLGDLPAGESRPLKPQEIAALRNAAQAVIRLGGARRDSPRPRPGRPRGPARR